MLLFILGTAFGFIACFFLVALLQSLTLYQLNFSPKKLNSTYTTKASGSTQPPPIPHKPWTRLENQDRKAKQTGLGHIWERAWNEVMQHAGIQKMLSDKIEKKLNAKNNTDFLGELKVEYFKMGPDAPVFSNAEFIDNGSEEVTCFVDMNYSNGIMAKINTELFINWPSPKFATCNASIIITMNSLCGRVCLEIPQGEDPICKAGFIENPQCNFSISTEVRELYGYGNIPGRASEFITKKVEEKILNKMLVRPRGIEFHLPIPKHRQMQMKIIPSNQSEEGAGTSLNALPLRKNPEIELGIEDFMPGYLEKKLSSDSDMIEYVTKVSEDIPLTQVSPLSASNPESLLQVHSSSMDKISPRKDGDAQKSSTKRSSFMSSTKSVLSSAKNMYYKPKATQKEPPEIPKRINRNSEMLPIETPEIHPRIGTASASFSSSLIADSELINRKSSSAKQS